MQYMLLIYADESAGASMTPEEGAKLRQEYTGLLAVARGQGLDARR